MISFFFKVKYSSIVYNNIFYIYGCLGWFCFLAVASKVATNTMSQYLCGGAQRFGWMCRRGVSGSYRHHFALLILQSVLLQLYWFPQLITNYKLYLFTPKHVYILFLGIFSPDLFCSFMFAVSLLPHLITQINFPCRVLLLVHFCFTLLIPYK